jgi:hypothetical protein
MLAGRPPFEGEPAELLKSHLLAPAPTLASRSKRRNTLPSPELEAFVARALAKPRDGRFQTADEMLSALEAVAEPWFVPVAPEEGTLEQEAEHVPTIPSPAADPARIDAYLAGARLGSQPASAARDEHAQTRGRRRLGASVAVLAVVAGAVLLVSPWDSASPLGDPPASSDAPNERAQERGREQELAAARPAATEATEPSAPAAIALEPSGLEDEPEDDGPELELQVDAPTEPEAAEATVAAEPEGPTRPRAKNPWAQGIPRALAAARKAALAGERGNERMVQTLRRYNRDSGTDTRGHLLLARLYRNRRWREDALKQYEMVHQIDPSARGASDMLEGLLQIVARGGKAGTGAAGLLERAYGKEALPALERSIRALEPQNLPAVQARITALRDTIASPSTAPQAQ